MVHYLTHADNQKEKEKPILQVQSGAWAKDTGINPEDIIFAAHDRS
jgi:hypothetical protein